MFLHQRKLNEQTKKEVQMSQSQSPLRKKVQRKFDQVRQDGEGGIGSAILSNRWFKNCWRWSLPSSWEQSGTSE